jgi:hypothetical protein
MTMKTKLLMIALCCALFLNACTSAPAAPTATQGPPPPTLSETREATLPPLNPTPPDGQVFQPTTAAQGFIEAAGLAGQVTIVAPGTLTFAEETEIPGAATPLPRNFVSLSYIQIGGAGNQELVVELRADGTLIRNGVAGAIAPAEVAAVIAAIDKIRFFEITGNFSGPLQTAEGYRFGLTVVTDNGDRSLEAVEGYAPAELTTLFFNLAQLGITPFPTVSE